MSLSNFSDTHERINSEELDAIRALIKSSGGYNDPISSKKLDNLIDAARTKLANDKIFINQIAAGKELLREIILNALNYDDLSAAKYHRALNAWAEQCQKLGVLASVQQRELHDNASHDIAWAIRNGVDPSTIWQSEDDIKLCLRGLGLITDSKEIKDGSTSILLPVGSGELRGKLQDVLNVLNSLPEGKGTIKLAVPVNCGKNENDKGTHWRLAKIEIQQKQVTSAVLCDSMNSTHDSQHKAAVQNAINEVFKGSNVEVTSTVTKTQKNSSSCGDYLVQEALEYLDKDNHSDPSVQAILQAKDDASLRKAIIARILLGIVERATSKSVSIEDQAVQIWFDRIMAEKISELQSTTDEEKLEGAAKKEALEFAINNPQTLNKVVGSVIANGIFSPQSQSKTQKRDGGFQQEESGDNDSNVDSAAKRQKK